MAFSCYENPLNVFVKRGKFETITFLVAAILLRHITKEKQLQPK